MPLQLITDPTKWNKLKCQCGAEIFGVLVHVTGALMICAKCMKKYKLESQSGVKVIDA
jgi:hypothetical protein